MNMGHVYITYMVYVYIMYVCVVTYENVPHAWHACGRIDLIFCFCFEGRPCDTYLQSIYYRAL